MLSSHKLLSTSIRICNPTFTKDLLKCRLHISATSISTPGRRRLLFNKKESPLQWGLLSSIKFASNDSKISNATPTPELSDIQELPKATAAEEILPDAPQIPQVLPDSIDVTQLAAEPTFESLGFGGWTPVGLIQNSFEFLHITCELPWWGSIVVGTIIVRLMMFPLVIITQRNNAKMNNVLPQIQDVQLRMSDARQRGDKLDAARCSQEMLELLKTKGINPIKNMFVPMAQAPLFISFFISLRQMANLPVESLKNGGIFWFMDLTLPDQFYLLPLITSATLAVTIEVGADTAKLNAGNMGLWKYGMRAIPFIVFPFSIGFPSAILVYWTSSNFISLIQVAFLKIPEVRKYFNIEYLVAHKKETLPIKDKGFVKGVKETWTNLKITREIEQREYADKMNFVRAGRGSVIKTYKYDPTKQNKPSSVDVNAIQAKKRH